MDNFFVIFGCNPFISSLIFFGFVFMMYIVGLLQGYGMCKQKYITSKVENVMDKYLKEGKYRD